MKKAAPRKESLVDLDLSPQEIDIMREQFYIIDRQRTGYISSFELTSLFDAVSEYSTPQKLQQVLTWAEEKSASRKLDINLALRAWSYLKGLSSKEDEEEVDVDILNTFVAMGGNTDKTGSIKKEKLIYIIKKQFELKIDMELMFEEAGIDVDHELTFYDLVCLLESGGSQRASRICSIFSAVSTA